MIVTEAEALGKICIPLLTGGLRMQPREPAFCIGQKCMAHWKWANEEKTEGFCSYDIQIQDKPKIK